MMNCRLNVTPEHFVVFLFVLGGVYADESCPELCADGFPDASRVIEVPTYPDPSTMTCGEYFGGGRDAPFYEIDYVSYDCYTSQLKAFTLCGCTPPSMDDQSRCSLCADFSIPPTEFWDAPFMDEDYDTCADGIWGAAELEIYFDKDGNKVGGIGDICSIFQGVGASRCGCPPLDQPKCSLCQGGESVSFPEKVVIEGTTCQFFADGVTGIDPQSEGCPIYQMAIGPYCGCSNDLQAVSDQINLCQICGAGNSLPEPGRLVEVSLDAGRDIEASAEIPCFFGEYIISAPNTAVLDGFFLEGFRCDEPYSFRDQLAEKCCDFQQDQDDVQCEDAPKSDSVPILQKMRKNQDENTKRDCAWLATQDTDTVDAHCANFGRIRRACPQTCGTCRPNDDDCADKTNRSFPAFLLSQKNCNFLSKRSRAKTRKLCRWSQAARDRCPVTCNAC